MAQRPHSVGVYGTDSESYGTHDWTCGFKWVWSDSRLRDTAPYSLFVCLPVVVCSTEIAERLHRRILSIL